jgi:hypothetical protein
MTEGVEKCILDGSHNRPTLATMWCDRSDFRRRQGYVDVEAEIIAIKRRVEALEAALGTGGEEPSVGVAEVLAELADVRIELGHECAAVGDELIDLRRQIHEHVETARDRAQQRLDILHCEMFDLGIRLDRLLEEA